jgi:hypothetical protein
MSFRRCGGSQKPLIAFGPEMPGWGSWDWVGLDIQEELRAYYDTISFSGQRIPPCDIAVLVKLPLPLSAVEEAARRSRVIYAPLDFYGSAKEIEADASMLRRCATILVHSERLRPYLERYARVEYMDHHVKFVVPLRERFREEGLILWVGVRSNLRPLVEWVNNHSLAAELVVLTNPEDPREILTPGQFGFRSSNYVRIEHWSKEKQIDLTAQARAAIDIKGTDFRSLHKPPAKALDFIASGVPLAMNPDSCVVEHLARMGFEAASPLDTERWLSREYWEETRRFGSAVRELLSLKRVGFRYRCVIEDVLADKVHGLQSVVSGQ